MNIDFQLEHALNRYAGHHELLDRIAVRVAESQVEVAAVVFVALALGLVLRRRRIVAGTTIALVAAAVALAGNVVIPTIWARQRPFVAHPHTVRLLTHHPPDAGFPSDHAAALAAIAVALLFFVRWLGAVTAVWALLVGVARVYVGEHYPADVVAGYLLGALAAAAVVLALRRLADASAVTRLPRVARDTLALARR